MSANASAGAATTPGSDEGDAARDDNDKITRVREARAGLRARIEAAEDLLRCSPGGEGGGDEPTGGVHRHAAGGAEVRMLRRELDACRLQLEQRSDALGELESWAEEFNQVREAFEASRTAQRDLRARAEAGEAELARCRADATQARERAEAGEAELARWRADETHLRAEADEAELARCRADATQARAAKEAVLKELAACRDLLQNAHLCLKASREQEDGLEKKLRGCEQELSTCRAQLDEKNAALQRLQQELDACAQQLEEAEASRQSAPTAVMERIQGELDFCAHQLKEARKENAIKTDEIMSLQRIAQAREERLKEKEAMQTVLQDSLDHALGELQLRKAERGGRVAVEDRIGLQGVSEKMARTQRENEELRRTVEFYDEAIGRMQTQLDQERTRAEQSNSEKMVLARQMEIMRMETAASAGPDVELEDVAHELEVCKQQRARELEEYLRLQQEREVELEQHLKVQEALTRCQEKLEQGDLEVAECRRRLERVRTDFLFQKQRSHCVIVIVVWVSK